MLQSHFAFVQSHFVMLRDVFAFVKSHLVKFHDEFVFVQSHFVMLQDVFARFGQERQKRPDLNRFARHRLEYFTPL